MYDFILDYIRANMANGPTMAAKMRQDAVPVAESEEDVQAQERKMGWLPEAPRPPRIAETETGVRALERQMWPDLFTMGVPNTAPSYPQAEDPMTAGGFSYPEAQDPMKSGYPSAGPSQAQRPRQDLNRVIAPKNPGTQAFPQSAPLPPPRPQAPAQQAPTPPPSESAWIDPSILAAQGEAQRKELGYPTTAPPGVGRTPPPGAGVMNFLGSGAADAFKQSAQPQENPVMKLMALLGGGGFK